MMIDVGINMLTTWLTFLKNMLARFFLDKFFLLCDVMKNSHGNAGMDRKYGKLNKESISLTLYILIMSNCMLIVKNLARMLVSLN